MKTVWILIIGIALFLLFLPKCYCDGCYIDIGGHVLYSIRWDIETYPTTSAFPRIAIDSEDNVHIIWMDQRDYPNNQGGDPARYNEGFYEIYYKKLDNNGNAIINDKRLTPSNDIVNIEFD